jgi:tetratricopeptide (TPR) repeat protein
MSSQEKTQPKSPFKTPPVPAEPPFIDPEAEPVRSGPGCALYGIIGVLAIGFALAIVLLAGAAGWTSGQRLAQEYATATQNAAITDQISRIPGDVSSRNSVMLNARIEFLATLTPGVPGMAEVMQTATALFNELQPTITPELTVQATQGAATPTAQAQVVITQAPDGQYDLPGLLEEASAMVSVAQYDEAIDLLDAIIAVDENFERENVRALMLEALSTQALNLFRTGTSLAKAINLAERAKEFGLSPNSDLFYEQYIAGLYLQAKSAVGSNYPVAIQALSEIYNTAPNYADVQQLLFDQYVGYGDAWVAGGEYCPAVQQYQNALNLFSNGGVAAKRDNAQTVCAQGTPIPGSAPLDGTPMHPIGMPSS